MMRQFVMISGLVAACLTAVPSRQAEAGPLLDWLFHRPAYGQPVPVGAPYPVASGYSPYATGYATLPATTYPYSTGYTPYGVAYPTAGTSYAAGYSNYSLAPQNYAYAGGSTVPSYGTYYGSTAPVLGATGYGYLTQRPPNNTISAAPAIIPPSSPVTLVPDYRSTASRVPVTYYRPVLTTDPSTGAQVVTLAPCSSYEYQTQRVPTWGLSQVFNGGATLPGLTTPAPVISPTYSLPRGGVPLSGPIPATQPYSTGYGVYPNYPATNYPATNYPSAGSVITPAAPSTVVPAAPYSSGYSGYASNYGNYSTLQPSAAVPATGTYSTAPYSGSSSSYYGASPQGGSLGGGSTGSILAPGGTIPGGTAPYGTAPYGTAPYTPPTSGTTTPLAPGNYPNAPILPPGSPSSDPAAGSIPSLPPNYPSGARLDSKPQLQNIVQQPVSGLRAPSPSTQPDTSNSYKPTEGLLPIPVPEDFDHEPRWNPGLLKEKDTTAQRSSYDMPQAWGSKPIQWASLRRSSSQATPELELEAPQTGVRPRQTDIIRQAPVEIPPVNFPPVQPAAAAPAPAPGPALRFDLWQAVK